MAFTAESPTTQRVVIKVAQGTGAAHSSNHVATIGLGIENEHADTGQDGQTCLARFDYQAHTRELTTSRLGNDAQSMPNLLKLMTKQQQHGPINVRPSFSTPT